MPTSEVIVIAAREWMGTPFHPQGRIMGVGVDCLGLIMGVAKQLNILSTQGGFLTEYDQFNYDISAPNANALSSHLKTHFLVAKEHMEPGMVLSCINAKDHVHLGIINSNHTFIHACMLYGMVVEEKIPQSVRNELWRFAPDDS